MVSKRRSSRYEFGARSPHWLKFPHRRRTSWVVGGWRPETGSATRLGAVLVGEPTSEGLVYRGRVGSGIAGKVGPMLLEALATYARDTSPFVDEVPRVDAVGTRWVEPVLVVDVESLGLSRQQRLRQPSYRGVRPDLNPEDLT
jgi:bifunctional non-homologous end joining protein LigD